MKDFYCYICNNYITHDVFMAHDLAFCCNTHRNTHLRKLNGLENNIIKTKKNIINTNTNIFETISSYNNVKYNDKKTRTCSMLYDYLSYIK